MLNVKAESHTGSNSGVYVLATIAKTCHNKAVNEYREETRV